ncbi:MAG: hypothetical protein JSV27_02635, partial [Candidatus Bathyarchaeota archaeon]
TDSTMVLRTSIPVAVLVTAMVYAFIYGMKKRDVDSIRWDTIQVGWPWYEDKHKPAWLVRKKKRRRTSRARSS